MTEIKVGVGVERTHDKWNGGRKGNVVELNGGRARVYWMIEPDGCKVRNSSGGDGVRTWVKFQQLRVLPAPVEFPND